MKKLLESILLKAINIDRFLPIQLDITNACNLRCIHCYHPDHKNEGALSLDQWTNVIIQYKTLIQKMKYRPWVILCGGEPLTSPYLIPILELVKNYLPNTVISILTNGTLINEQIISKLSNFKNINFQISLDGPSADRHDLIRGKGNFDRAVQGIRFLKNRGFDVDVLAVLSRKTSLWMEDFFKLAKAEEFKSINFTRFVTEGYGRKLLNAAEDEPLMGQELKAAYENLLQLMMKYQIKSKTQGPLFELLIPGLGRSGRFWESIVIDYQGYILASSRSQLKLGHAIKNGIEDIFLNHSVYQGLRKGKVEVCGECSLYTVCGGDRNAAYASTGNFLGSDPGCWNNENQTRRAQ